MNLQNVLLIENVYQDRMRQQTINTNELYSWANESTSNREMKGIIHEVIRFFEENGIQQIQFSFPQFINIYKGMEYFKNNIPMIEDIGIDRYITNTLQIFHLETIFGNRYQSLFLRNINRFSIPHENPRVEYVNQQNSMRGGFNPKRTIFFMLCIFLCLSSSMFLAQNIQENQSRNITISRNTKQLIRNNTAKRIQKLNQNLYRMQINTTIPKNEIHQKMIARKKEENTLARINQELKNTSTLFDTVNIYFFEYWDKALLFFGGLFIDIAKKGLSIQESLTKRIMFVANNKMKKNQSFLFMIELVSFLGTESEITKCKKEIEKYKKEIEIYKTDIANCNQLVQTFRSSLPTTRPIQQ